jgi:hypothetical protein
MLSCTRQVQIRAGRILLRHTSCPLSLGRDQGGYSQDNLCMPVTQAARKSSQLDKRYTRWSLKGHTFLQDTLCQPVHGELPAPGTYPGAQAVQEPPIPKPGDPSPHRRQMCRQDRERAGTAICHVSRLSIDQRGAALGTGPGRAAHIGHNPGIEPSYHRS